MQTPIAYQKEKGCTKVGFS